MDTNNGVMAMCDGQQVVDHPTATPRRPIVPVEELIGETWLKYGAPKYSIADRRLQGPWWVRFGRWLRRQPQPTVRGSSRTTGI